MGSGTVNVAETKKKRRLYYNINIIILSEQ